MRPRGTISRWRVTECAPIGGCERSRTRETDAIARFCNRHIALRYEEPRDLQPLSTQISEDRGVEAGAKTGLKRLGVRAHLRREAEYRRWIDQRGFENVACGHNLIVQARAEQPTLARLVAKAGSRHDKKPKSDAFAEQCR